MFGLFRNRNKFNGDVDVKLNNEYDIKTRDNPLFPEEFKYLNILDQAWNEKYTEDESAMFIAALYYSGLIKSGKNEAAAALRKRIASVGQYGVSRGTISLQRASAFLAHIEVADGSSP